MKVDVSRTSKGAIKAATVIAGKVLFAQSDTIHGALRNLAFEVQQNSACESYQMAEWQKEPRPNE